MTGCYGYSRFLLAKLALISSNSCVFVLEEMGFLIVVGWKMHPYWCFLIWKAPMNYHRKVGPIVKFDAESNGDLSELV